MESKDYKSRLIALKLRSLEYRRGRDDMIKAYKILNNISNYNSLSTYYYWIQYNNKRSLRKCLLVTQCTCALVRALGLGVHGEGPRR